MPIENHFRHLADFPQVSLASGWQADCFVGQASRLAAIDADKVRMFGLPPLMKGEPPDVIAQIDADCQPRLGQIVQATKHGRCSETRSLQLLTDLRVCQRRLGSGQQL